MTTKEINLTEVIESEKQQTLSILTEAKNLRLKELSRREANKGIEEYKWDRFLKIIERKQYFRIAHIDELNIPYHICIHLSAKGAGKTTEIYRMIQRVLDKNEKFMYGRVYKHELEAEMLEFNQREESPVYAVEFKNRYYFFKKEDVNAWLKENIELLDGEAIPITPTFKKLQEAGFRHVGQTYTFVASNCLAGGTYEDYNTVFFDEILSYSPVNRISPKVLKAWGASVSTIQRNKPELKIYMFGNLQDVPNHPILSFYGIDINDKLRIIERGENGETKILFINSGGEYQNTIGHKGGAVHHTTSEHQIFLKYNKVIKPSSNILSPEIYGQMQAVEAFAAFAGPQVYFVELRRHVKDSEDNIYAISCKPLEISTISPINIYVDNPIIANTYTSTVLIPTIETMINSTYNLFKFKELNFDSVDTLNNWNQILNYNHTYLYDEDPDPLKLC